MSLQSYLHKVGMRRAGSSWLTRCPAHEDKTPSLSVSVGRDGRILLKCHAGCTLEQILDALGLTVKDLFPKDNSWMDGMHSGIDIYSKGNNIGLIANPVERKPDEYLNKVYRCLISLLSLSNAHREHLLARGINESIIERSLYRTLPLRRRQIVSRLLREYDLVGVPGFGKKKGSWVMTGSPGILLPVVFENLIVGFQIRLDRDCDGLRYKHLSSSWLKDGASSGARVHVSIPRIIRRPEIWITEGVLKADIAAHLLGAVVWSVPGVSNWHRVVDVWQRLSWQVVIAYDNDAKRKTKRAVRQAAFALANTLKEKGIRSVFAVWRNAKGIDDALVAGERVRLWPVPL